MKEEAAESQARAASIWQRASRRWRAVFACALVAICAFAVMGYHPGCEDDGVYLSAIQSDLNPLLYPHDFAFFRLQVQATIFDKFIAGFVRWTGTPVGWSALLWQFVSIAAIIFVCWSIGRLLFSETSAHLAGAAFVGAMFTLPVAGTALYIAWIAFQYTSVSQPAGP